MIGLNIQTQGEACWPDLQARADQLTWLSSGAELSIARLPAGMASGRSSVAIRVDLPDGRVIVVETSMALFLACAQAFAATEEPTAPGAAPAQSHRCPRCGRYEDGSRACQIGDPESPVTAPAQPATEQQARWRPEVVAFADAMERKLRANDWKGGWKDDAPGALMDRVREEFDEAQRAHLAYPRDTDEYRQNLLDESADVANMLMMVCDVAGALATPPQEPQAPAQGAEAVTFESAAAQALESAWRDGWACCRDAEFVGEEAEQDAFNASATLARCLDVEHPPAPSVEAQAEQSDRAASEHPIDVLADEPWTRDPESTQGLLTLVGLQPSLETIATWTDEQCQQAEAWAAATHLRASDNDVDVPIRPGFLPDPWTGPVDNQWGNGPTEF